MPNNKLTMDAFRASQREALASWPTGKGVDFDKAVTYQKAMPEHLIFSKKLQRAKAEKRTMLQPRAGVPALDKHIELMRCLANEGEADMVPTTMDSYTRHNRYKEAQKGLEESVATGKAMLNGFPAVNHGVDICRTLIESVDVPMQIRHGTPDARLLCEISYAGGFTSFEGGGISYNIPYSKNTTLSDTIRNWKYVDFLTGLYEEAGVPIDREPFGPLTGTLVPPCVSHACGVLEALLAAEQGVKHISVGYGQLGNLFQDVAAIRSLEQVTREYLDRYGYRDVEVFTVFHQWMGGFPPDEAKAYGVISWGACGAVLSGADKVITKSPHEAYGIPTKEANAAGLRATRQLANMLSCQIMEGVAQVEQEKQLILAETRALLDTALRLGRDDFEAASVAAFEAGVIDVPFSPSKYNRGDALPARDNDGAVRFLAFGGLPLPDDLKAVHIKKMEARSAFEKRPIGFQMVIDDVYAISSGFLVGRPGTTK